MDYFESSMSAPLQLTGIRFGKLIVEQEASRRNGKTYWFCRCDCGKTIEVHGVNLKRGNTKSCGCGTFRFPTKHGLHRSVEYQAWADMLTRCRNPQTRQWYLYGGRGIKVCERWVGEDGFENFYSDMSPRPVGLSIDRIDNEGDYEPGNCRWATKLEQANNTRFVHRLTYLGETLSVSEWARRTGLGVPTIFSRIRLGWPTDKVLTIPKHRKTIPLTYRGRTLSLCEWGRRTGLTAQTIKNRLDRGWSIGKALESTPKRMLAFGKLVLSVADWAKRTGLPKRVINDRLRAGWSVKRTLTKNLAHRRPRLKR
jgi:hypothetical protein